MRYRIERIRLPDGAVYDVPVRREQGIDLRLGLDVVRMARNYELDVAAIFTKDQDPAEAAREIRDIARTGDRWLKVVSAFPREPNSSSDRGMERTDRFQMDREFYIACLDPRNYRPNR
ncbi:MAG: hypothetical protein OXN84_20380 [Albidovulum sp.]|nr:hypothetical protein [Albidovulum sp.]